MPAERDDKSYHISGNPGAQSFSQTEDPGAEPNRDEAAACWKIATMQNVMRDYFDDEEERLSRATNRASSPNEEWAPDGVTDEANQYAEANWSGAPYKDQDAPPGSDLEWVQQGEESLDLQKRSQDF